MADQEDQNKAEDGEVLKPEPSPGQTSETEEQNAAADQSNNQGEGQSEEAVAKDDQVVDAEQALGGVTENPPSEAQEPATENVEDGACEQGVEQDKAEVPAEGETNENQNADVDQREAQRDKEPEKAEEPAGEAVQEPAEQEANNVQPEQGEEAAGKAEQATAEDAKPTEEPAADSAPVEERAADSAPVEEAAAESVPVEETAAGSAPAEEPAANSAQAEGQDVDSTPVEEPAADSVPVEETSVDSAPSEEPVADSAPAEEQAADNTPAPAEEVVAAPAGETDGDAVETAPEDVQEKQEEADVQEEAEPPVEDEIEATQVQPVEGDPAPVEAVQVETSVQDGPPGSPKVAMEEGRKQPNVNLEATATVKFVLMPSGQVVTLACTLGQTLQSLKSHFAGELKMSTSLIMIMFDGKSMMDSTTLADLGVGPNGTVQLEMQSADPVNTPLKPYRPRQEYHMPDVITVRVTTEDGEAKDVVVEIERSRSKKPFLGGFRNKNSGIEFHNAAAQTAKKPRPPPTVERFCRDTQTCEQKNTRQQTTNTTSTQMTGIGVFVSNMEDKLITPGKYFSAGDHWDLILRNVIILQKYYRRWLAKRYVTKLKEDKAKRLEWERQEELRKKRDKEERIKRDYARRLNPKTKADFDMLLNCLEKWRQEEMERINSTLTGAERKAALCMLLDQETELLSAIERHKNEANKDNRDNQIIAFLEKAAAPKKWQGHDGNLTYMDTPFTIRAKELRDIYNSINMKYLTQDERLDVLLTLKHTVKEHDCKLTQEIIELIDREADLLMRGVKEGNLTGLRKRISTLFLQYIKTPTFNPEAARLLKVPQDPSSLRKNINYCHSCGRYLPSTEFFITSNSKQVGRCRNCMKVENDGRQREDYTFYRVMLKSLRKSEEAMQDGSSICYLLQDNDLRYLVENIWSNQSVLSAWDDLYDLVLVRWDKHQEWSPWNCILLTHDEAEAHQKLFSLEEGYGQVFIHKVTQKHNFARNYFSRLPGMAELLRQKVGNRDLINNTNGPTVSGHTVPKAQKV